VTDRFTVRAVVVFLGLIAMLGLTAISTLAFGEKVVPDALIATTSASVGALGAVLARTGTGSEDSSGDHFGGGVG
jgi:energy-converting hydrogenase Eha subunit A